MRTIKEWQRDAYELAREKGFHSRECPIACRKGRHEDMTSGEIVDCDVCHGTGRVPIDPHSPTRIASRLALIHCEISEAVECVARGGRHMRLHWMANGCVVEDVADGCYRAGPWKPGQAKPEGFPIELADVFLRLCDLAESLGLTMVMPEAEPFATPETDPEIIATKLNALHDTMPPAGFLSTPEMRACNLTDVTYLIDWRVCRLNDVLHALFDVADATGVDLLAMAELKHAYNRTRPIRHGGKLL